MGTGVRRGGMFPWRRTRPFLMDGWDVASADAWVVLHEQVFCSLPRKNSFLWRERTLLVLDRNKKLF
jgi:hypothetical protein